MKSIIIIFALVSFSFAQSPFDTFLFYNQQTLTVTDADTVGSITLSDSVEIQMGENGPWKLLTQSVNDTALITGDDKVAENTVLFNLASESWWTYIPQVRIRIFSTGVDTATSYPIFIPKYANGAITVEIVADTIGANVHYSKSRIYGN